MSEINCESINNLNSEEKKNSEVKMNAYCQERVDVGCTENMNHHHNIERMNTDCVDRMNPHNMERMNLHNTQNLNLNNAERMNTDCTERVNSHSVERMNTDCAERINPHIADRVNVDCAERVNMNTSITERMNTDCEGSENQHINDRMNSNCTERVSPHIPERMDTDCAENVNSNYEQSGNQDFMQRLDTNNSEINKNLECEDRGNAENLVKNTTDNVEPSNNECEKKNEEESKKSDKSEEKTDSQDDGKTVVQEEKKNTEREQKKNLFFERHHFNSRFQGEEEPFDTFLADLEARAHRCGYGDLTEDLIKDRIIAGIFSDELKARLLQFDYEVVDLEKLVEECRTFETNRLKELEDELQIISVSKGTPNSDKDQGASICKVCGLIHDNKRGCPGLKRCRKCQKNGHIEEKCPYASRLSQGRNRKARRAAVAAVAAMKPQSRDDDGFMDDDSDFGMY